MRIKLDFDLEAPYFPIESRRSFLSIMKRAISDYDQRFFQELYGSNKMKDFTFSIYFPIESISNEQILLKEKRFNVYMSFSDMKSAIEIYNAWRGIMEKSILVQGNQATLKKITVAKAKNIWTNQARIKMLSPLLVRDGQNHERYLLNHAENFETRLREIIAAQLKELQVNDLAHWEADNFKIVAQNLKKVVVKHYGQTIDGYLGTMDIAASPELIQYLYDSGMGSRRTMGFGMFEMIS